MYRNNLRPAYTHPHPAQRRSTSSCTSCLGCTCAYLTHTRDGTPLTQPCLLAGNGSRLSSSTGTSSEARGSSAGPWWASPLHRAEMTAHVCITADILLLKSLLSPLRAHWNVSVHSVVVVSTVDDHVHQHNCTECHEVVPDRRRMTLLPYSCMRSF